MNKKIILAGIGLVVILCGYMYVYKFGVGSKIDSSRMTLAELLSKGGSHKCEIRRILDRGFSGDATIGGTAYIGNGMIRVDYPNALSLIYKDKKTYNWRPENNITGEDDFSGWIVEDTTYGPSTYQWDSSMVTEFNCVYWKMDLAQFNPPKNVVFPKMVPPLP